MTDDVSLFVRSYPNDFEWLKYSIRSMEKNLHGIDETVLVVPATKEDLPKEFKMFFDRIFFTQETHEGYVAQQIDKVKAYKYCTHENILFSDSDCIYYQPFGAGSLLTDDNKCILYRTRYSSLMVEDMPAHIQRTSVMRWKPITEQTTGIDPDHEYMRCFPIMHKALTCHALDSNPIYQRYIANLRDRSLSEFNALGVLADKTELCKQYELIDTESKLPEVTAKQYWSWGGITTEIRSQLETI